MPRIPLFGPGINSRSSFVTAKHMQNMYCEQRPQGEKASVVAYGTPGLTLFGDVGDTPIRGALEFEPSTVAYFVHRGVFYEINNAGTITNRGVLNTTTGRVGIAHNGVQVMIVDGTDGYIYNTATTVFSVVVFGFTIAPATVAFMSRRFVVSTLSAGVLGRFYVSAIDDGLTWAALDFSTAESSPDPINSVWQSTGQLFLLGTLSSEPWGNSGALDFPFAAIQGAATEWGLAARWSVARYDNSFACLIRNRMGQVMVAKMNGYLPQKISTPDLDDIINGYGNVSDATAFSYMLGGHPMYVINFPTAEATWLFDGSISQWSQLKSFGLTRYRGEIQFGLNGMTMITDYAVGRIYRLLDSAYTDNGDSIEREIIAENIARPGLEFLSVDCVRLDMETGVGLPGVVTPYHATQYLNLPGASGDYASTLDSAALDITGDIELIAYAASDDWTNGASQNLVSKWLAGGNQRSYSFGVASTGILYLDISTDGIATTQATSAAPSLGDRTGYWLRVTRVSATGVTAFYKSSDAPSTALADITWTQITTAGSTTAGAIFAGTALGEVGARSGGTVGIFDGKIYSAYVYNGIGGTLVASFDANDGSVGGTSWVSSDTGETWTTQGASSIVQVVDPDGAIVIPATLGANPQVGLSVSRDNGKTWGPEMWKPAGPVGEYLTRVEWRRLGTAREYSFKFRFTDPVPWNVVSACVNPDT